ncbi:DUF4062 domain-containing protein [Morganella morganii]|nr:DUF4062 domain-containing protein [Morganella morganii]
MDKRYQVFVSSTFTDLQEERQNVIQALMSMDCIPAGMELFPAADEEQWDFIKKIIDDCDYYLLIIGGRYGSVSEDGFSYTEKEFDYAVEKGLKIIALVHGEPDKLPFEKSESTPEYREKLLAFRKKVTTGRLVKFWTDTSALSGLVLQSLINAIKIYPAIGWVRSNQVASNELLTEINQLRKENEKLKIELSNNNTNISSMIHNIANLNDEFIIHGFYEYETGEYPFNRIKTEEFEYSISWNRIFSIISAYLITDRNSQDVNNELAKRILTLMSLSQLSGNIIDYDFETIIVQFLAYGLIKIIPLNNSQSMLALSDSGQSLMLQLRTQKSIGNEH